MAAPNLHELLCADVELRSIVTQYAEPSLELVNFVTWLLPAGRQSLEIGLSGLSIALARRSEAHLVVLPTRKAADSLAALLAGLEKAPPALTIATAEGSAALAGVAGESLDIVILSCAPAFPAYFAWCHEALRVLRVGGRLIVRGTGVWTIEQFKNHLRIDPRFVGWSIVAPDAIAVTKHAETQDVPWSAQPYVLVNSSVHNEAALRHARAQPLRASVEAFSSDATNTARLKVGRQIPEVGLVGYYGYGNYGDELFRTAFERGLPDVRLKIFTDMPRRPFVIGDRRARADQMDAILIGGGDLLSAGYWPDPYIDEAYLRRPVFLHGVGVPRWTGGDPKVIARMRAFMQHPNVRHINVRDVESRDWVMTHLRPGCPVEVSADLVFSLDLAPPPASRARPVLVVITRKRGGANDDYEGLKSLMQTAKTRGYAVRLVIAGAGSTADDDLEDALTRDLDVDEIVFAPTMEEVTAAIVESDVVVSMKFHGCVVGLMAGKPTFGLVATDKFVNLYRSLGIDHMALTLTHPDVAGILDQPRVTIDAERLMALRESARAALTGLNDRILASTRKSD